MEKVYRLLHWLDMAQALDYLQDLTETPVTEYLLLQLCEARQCQAFADVDGVEGHDWSNGEVATAKGIHLVTNPVDAFASGWSPRSVCTTGDVFGRDGVDWSGDLPPWKRGPIFQPSDIEALAAKMNDMSGRSTEAEDLRQELEQERATRQVIESELRERRVKDGTSALGAIRQMLAHTPEEFSAMRERAEEAERMVAKLKQQLTAQDELRKADGKALDGMARQLRELHGGQQTARKSEDSTTHAAGLTFPYSTKQLEAARAAALKYWCDFDPERPPLQKTVSGFMVERGVPARQAQELAIAIKPDGQKKA